MNIEHCRGSRLVRNLRGDAEINAERLDGKNQDLFSAFVKKRESARLLCNARERVFMAIERSSTIGQKISPT